MQTAVEFESDGQTIRGMFHSPDGADRPVPGVLLCHGFTGTKCEPHWIFVKTSRRLAEAGIASLRFDFRGSGESDGEFADMTVLTEVSDAGSALSYLAARDEVNGARLGILGLSMGGFVTASLLANDSRPSSAVLWSAVCDFAGLLPAIMAQSRPTVATDAGHLDMNGYLINPGFMAAIAACDPVGGVKAFAGPLLIVHGDADETVPLDHARMYHEAAEARGAPTTLRVVKDGTHTFDSYSTEAEVISATVGHFGATLSA